MMKTSSIALSIVLLSAVPAAAQVMTPAEYLAAAGASDLYERTSSQTVLASTQDPKVRSFATMMIEDHTKSTAQVKAAAAKAGVKAPPPKLTPTQTELVAQLQAEQGPARDATYIAQQKASHNQALAVQKAYAKEGRPASLRNAAAGIVPVVEHHIMMLKDM